MRLMRSFVILTVLFTVAGVRLTGTAQASLGDSLASFDASATADIPGCGVGTGIAFDGTSLLLSCWNSNVLERVDPVSHLNNGPLTIAGLSDINAIAYDGRRDRLWTCSNGSTVALVDLHEQKLDTSVPAFHVGGCLDGLAYDGSDDTIWSSPDASSSGFHYKADGTLITSFSNSGRLGSCGNSGIAVGGDKLYMANNGCSQIYQVSKDITSSTLISTFPRRIEDLECDEITFAPKAAIWSNDAYDRLLNAWEIPAGSCNHGGGVLPCEDLVVAVVRPIAGHIYSDDIDLGPSNGGTTIVRGTPLTVSSTPSDASITKEISVRLDGVLVGTTTSPPWSVTVPTGSLSPGTHALKIEARRIGSGCSTTTTTTIEVGCLDIGIALDRPDPAKLYSDDVEVGPSLGTATTLGGPLRVHATPTDAAQVSSVALSIDQQSVSLTSPPFQSTFDTSALAPGLHHISAKVHELNPACFATTTVDLLRVDPGLRAEGEGVFATITNPLEPVLHAGGTTIGHDGGSNTSRIVDRSIPGVVDYAHAITDQAQGTRGEPFVSDGDSLISDVSLLGGMITADLLHAHAHSTYTLATGATSTDDGDSELVGLRIGGVPIDIDQPNTTLLLPNGAGRVVAEEELGAQQDGRAELTVNALHVYARTPQFRGEIVIGSAYAGVNVEGQVFDGPLNRDIGRPDDAGTGADAGDDFATATPLDPGIYGGGLSDTDGSDFFKFPTRQGERIVATLKPSERQSARLLPGPALDNTETTLPAMDLTLYDPDGQVRARSELHVEGSEPQRVEMNVDKPYTPADAKAPWVLEVSGEQDSAANYTLSLSLVPEQLMDQNDAGTGDAPDTCAQARALTPSASAAAEVEVQSFAGVIKDADQADYFSVHANIGQNVIVTVKPDELDDGANFDLLLHIPSEPGGTADCSYVYEESNNGTDPTPKGTPDAVGALPAPVTGTYVFGVTRVNGVGNYYVSVSVVNPLPTLPGNDAMTGSDAPGTCPQAVTIATGVYEARMDDSPDDEDWYAVNLTQGQDLSVLLKPSDPSDLNLDLYAPDCTPAAVDTTATHLPLSAPEAVHLKDGAPGLWKIGISRGSGGGNYLLSIVVNP